MVNVVLFTYGRGVVRAALDEGVRTGSRVEAAAAECHARARDALGDLLGGAMGDGVRMRCGETARGLRATADVTFAGWAPLVPDWSFTIHADAISEAPP